MALDVGPPREGHALLCHALEAARPHHLPRRAGDVQDAPVQVLDREAHAAERVAQGDVFLDHQVLAVVAHALERGVLLLHHHQHHVPGLKPRLADAGLAAQDDLLAVARARLDGHLKGLLLADQGAAAAGAAPVAVGLRRPGAVALAAARLDLLHHAGADGADVDLHAAAVARVALVALAGARAGAIAGAALHLARKGELPVGVGVGGEMKRRRRVRRCVFFGCGGEKGLASSCCTVCFSTSQAFIVRLLNAQPPSPLLTPRVPPREQNSLCDAAVQVLQRHLQLVHHVVTAPLARAPAAAAAAEQLPKQVCHAAAAAAAVVHALLDRVLSVLRTSEGACRRE